MKSKNIFLIIVFTLFIFLNGCSNNLDEVSNEIINEEMDENDSVQLANPASTYCIENNGTLKIVEKNEGQVGMCVFEDGYECEEWAYYNGECSPEKFDEQKVYCTPESKEVEICTMEYAPVCGYFYSTVQCIKAPCAITASNNCMACANEQVEYYVEGECPKY